MMEKISKKENLGITLIALIITIIVLLLLVGVTIVAIKNVNIINRSKQTKDITRYETAKETIDLKLMEIQTDCYSQNIEYNILEIEKEIKNDNKIEIEKFYNDDIASLKEGVTEDVVNLSGIVVYAKEYEEYKFLIGKQGKIDGVTTKQITNTTDETEFENVEKFEKENFVKGNNNKETKVDNNYYLFNNGVTNGITWSGRFSDGTNSSVGSYSIGKTLLVETHGIWCRYNIESQLIDFTDWNKIYISLSKTSYNTPWGPGTYIFIGNKSISGLKQSSEPYTVEEDISDVKGKNNLILSCANGGALEIMQIYLTK